MKEYTGNINETDENGNRRKWTKNGYSYKSECGKVFKTLEKKEEHEWNCNKCNTMFFLDTEEKGE